MKKVFLTAMLTFTLSACAGNSSNSNVQKQAKYDELSKCDVNIEAPSHSPKNKKEFAEYLSTQARNASADQFVVQKRMEILQMVGWNDSVADAIATCGSERKNMRKKNAFVAFEAMKLVITGADEKRALVEAYSSWEAFITSQTPLAKQDFDSKVGYYKNM
ncbi:hypothetical protein DC273_22080 [Salmonella enterica subsp. enterica serovar Thompson]|nr:hypothetical protein [Salmonella enterica subsp. enterica serovar Thompson]EBU4084583.1 hypothetical protein [Salmonella enterica]EBX3203398.1 hypothetical protein [Salmonella enterica subsp. enterica serovar Thompson]EDV5788358.1 hypothetical protein [Salmonella enterica subsp. enterica serovar Thompson]EDW1506668.1 hypothetical protein [Salmonella enterica subsp. enterica serovar Thompson]